MTDHISLDEIEGDILNAINADIQYPERGRSKVTVAIDDTTLLALVRAVRAAMTLPFAEFNAALAPFRKEDA